MTIGAATPLGRVPAPNPPPAASRAQICAMIAPSNQTTPPSNTVTNPQHPNYKQGGFLIGITRCNICSGLCE